MKTPTLFRNHPIHPMLSVFPIGLWILSFACDTAAMDNGNGLFWSEMAFYTMAGGILGALFAAAPGFLDYLGLQGRQLKRMAITHMILNLAIIVLYIFNLGLRMKGPLSGSESAVAISAIAMVLLAVSGWVGGLVYSQSVAVAPVSESYSEPDIHKHELAA